MSSLTLGDVIDSVPEIASFRPQIAVLRLADGNTVQIKNQPYELRVFAYATNPLSTETFAEWVRRNRLEEKVMQPYDALKIVRVLAYGVNEPSVYVNLALRPLDAVDASVH